MLNSARAPTFRRSRFEPRYEVAGRSVGWLEAAGLVRMHCSKKSRIDRPCARRLSQTVSIRSTKSDPVWLAEPKEFFRQSTAFRSARSAA